MAAPARCYTGFLRHPPPTYSEKDPVTNRLRPNELKNPGAIRAALELALFTFSFLSTEYEFDVMVGRLLDPEGVIGAQGLILGASAVGLVLVPWLVERGHQPRGRRKHWAIALGVLSIAPYALTFTCADALSACTLGCAAFFCVGGLGGLAHLEFARAFGRSTHLCRAIGLSYAGGILAQVLYHAALSGVAAIIAPAIGFLVLALLTSDAATQDTSTNCSDTAPLNPDSSEAAVPSDVEGTSLPTRKLALLALLIALLSCLFSTLDVFVTLANARGTFDVAELPRLLIAASAILSGVAFDRQSRRFRGVLMFCITLLSTSSLLVVDAGAPALVSLVLFYLGSGCFVVFFTSLFVEESYRVQNLGFLAGAGRAINNLCACLFALPSLMLVEHAEVSVSVMVLLVLFAATSAVFVFSGMFSVAAERAVSPSQPEQSVTPSAQTLESFCSAFALTPREGEILRAVVQSEAPLKSIAADMGISLRMLQRHLTSIYRKTDTQSRVGLTRAVEHQQKRV